MIAKPSNKRIIIIKQDIFHTICCRYGAVGGVQQIMLGVRANLIEQIVQFIAEISGGVMPHKMREFFQIFFAARQAVGLIIGNHLQPMFDPA